MKIKWIKVGDVIEVDGKKAKLISVVEDLTYADLYTFKREDGSKFYWRHENVYRYVMDRHIKKLESLLCEEKLRADRAEKRWSALRDTIKSNLVEAEGYEDHNKAMDLIEVLDKMHDLEEDGE